MDRLMQVIRLDKRMQRPGKAAQMPKQAVDLTILYRLVRISFN